MTHWTTWGQYCSSINCHNARKKNPNLSLFSFPKDRERCKRWVINTRRQDLEDKSVEYLHKNFRLCADHFEDSEFKNIPDKKSLNWNAIPTKFSVLEDKNMATDEILLPKLPFSSFYLFCLDEKPKIIEAFPDPTAFKSEVTKELGCRFLTCPRVNLAKYDALAEADFLRYEKELKEYHRLCEEKKRKLEESLSANVRSTKRKRGRNSKVKAQAYVEAPSEAIIPSPIEPLSPFFWFCLEKKLTDREQSSTLVELASTLSQKWQGISPAARSKFEKLAEIDKFRYEKDLITCNKKKCGSMSSESDTEIDEGSDSNGCSEDKNNCGDTYSGVEPGGVEDLLEIKLEYTSDHDD